MITTRIVIDSDLNPDSNPPRADTPALGLADLSFVVCIERTELGETWKVRAPGGKTYLCQFLPPHDVQTTETLLARLSAFRQAGLIPWAVVRDEGNRQALLAPLEGPTLWDRFQALWAANQPGVPREELLGYLRTAAQVLDLMRTRYLAQHLWLQPRQFVLHDGQAQLLGFGLVETWWAHTKRPSGPLNPRYAAPELQHKVRAARCDQYSLALIYSEMLTGTHPWRGRGTGWAVANPDLGLLPRHDRAVIRRALSMDYRQRFDTNTALVDALENGAKKTLPAAPPPSLVTSGPAKLHWNTSVVACNTLDQFVVELVTLVAGGARTPDELTVRFTLEPSRHLQSPKFLGGTASQLLLFDDFCRQWHAKTIRQGDGLIILAINAAPSVWQRLSGRRMGLEVRLEFLPVAWGNQRAQVAVRVRPFGCTGERGLRLLLELGPKLLQSVRAHLDGQPEQRGLERLAFRERLQVCPVVNGASAQPLDCITKDISAGGIGFFLPVELPASQVYVSLPEVERVAAYAALAQVVRKQPAHEGWFEIGAAFAITRQTPAAGRGSCH